ncbi:MAG: phosphatidate cytidylyltransferase [Eubacteriaceae bacterium]|nr:phosphatidate cytidylyltransferase [Eubacteriaceae bacterium]
MKDRIITALIALAVFVLIAYFGKWPLLALLLVLHTIAAVEYSSVVAPKQKNKMAAVFIVLGTSLLAIGAFYPENLMVAFVVCLLVLAAREILSADRNASLFAFLVWGFIDLSLFSSLAIRLLFTEGGFAVLMASLLSTVACDTFALLGGMLFGKTPLNPISPKKTVEGSVSGFIFATLAFSAAGMLRTQLKLQMLPMWTFVLAGALIGVTSQFGDLMASHVKRAFNVKDYGSLLPGHGGVFDRLDSVLFTFGTIYVYYTFLGFI